MTICEAKSNQGARQEIGEGATPPLRADLAGAPPSSTRDQGVGWGCRRENGLSGAGGEGGLGGGESSAWWSDSLIKAGSGDL